RASPTFTGTIPVRNNASVAAVPSNNPTAPINNMTSLFKLPAFSAACSFAISEHSPRCTTVMQQEPCQRLAHRSSMRAANARWRDGVIAGLAHAAEPLTGTLGTAGAGLAELARGRYTYGCGSASFNDLHH